MCVCCRCEFAPIKTMEKISFERKNGMQKEVFISTEATSQMSSVYLSGCNVFLYQTLALQRYTFSFWQIFYSYEYKRSVFSVSFFLSFSNSIQKFFDAFVHDNSPFFPFSLLFKLEFSFVVICFFFFFILSVQIYCDGLQVLRFTRREHSNQRYNGRNFTRGHKNSFFVCVCYFLF